MLTLRLIRGLQKDCAHVVKESIFKLGGLDVIISNAVGSPISKIRSEADTQKGYTRFSNFGDLNDSTVEDWDLCYAVNVKSHIFLMREALATFNANPDGGVFIITSSIAGRIPVSLRPIFERNFFFDGSREPGVCGKGHCDSFILVHQE
jgi:NAD(P)-dependent dehydrogenase (short-subunit alcohol dehydrogenase family)